MIGNESEYGRDQLVVEVLCVSVEAQPVLLLVTKIYSEHTRSAAHRRLAPRTPSNESLQMINPSNTVLCSMERIASSARAAPTIYNPYLASFSLHSQILSDCSSTMSIPLLIEFTGQQLDNRLSTVSAGLSLTLM